MRDLGPPTWTPGAADIVSAWLPSFAPPPKLSASAWAEANIVLPRATNAKPGELELSAYQAGMLDRASGPGVRVAVFMLASQTGKSISIDALLLDKIVRDPGPTLHVSPNDGKARAFVKERLDPLVAESPNLRGIFGTGRRGGDGDGLAYKAFSGGFLATASSFKADDLAARAIRYVFLDEVDRFAPSAGQEGDPVLLALKRQHTFRLRGRSLAVIASTPTDSNSRIAAWYAKGDQAKFFVPCPCCGDFAPLDWSRLKYHPGRPETAWLSCDACGQHLTEADRKSALAHGEWRATAEGEPGTLSFHGNVLLSDFTTLAEIAQAEESAMGSPETARVFVNTSKAEVYEVEGVTVEPDTLQSRAIEIVEPYPAEIDYVTLGADVQGDRIEATVLGHGQAGQLAVLNHHVLVGDTSGPVPWAALDKLMGSTFAMRDGRQLPIAYSAVDSGYQASTVYQFVAAQRFKGRRVNPVKGVSGFDRPNLARGSKSAASLNQTIMLVGVDSLKQEMMRRLNIPLGGASCVYMPDHLDMSYFEGLAAEKLELSYIRGFQVYKWRKIRACNEPLDCLIYAFAIAGSVPEAVKRRRDGQKTDLRLNHLHLVKG